MKSCNRTHENIWWRRGFFQGEATHCTFAGLILWLPKTSATRLQSFCLWEPAVVLEALKLKVFKCPNKVSNFFWVTSVSVNPLVPFQKQVKYHCHIELHLSCSRVPGSTSVFFFFYESKTINCSIVHRFAVLMPTLAHWLGDSQNYHVLCESILFWKIFRISLSMIIFAIILAKKKDIKLKYRKKSSLFCYFMKTFLN